MTPSPCCATVHALKPAPGHAEVSPEAVMGGTWRIPQQVNVPLFSQARWRARSLRVPARVRVQLILCQTPSAHGAGSSSGGLHQTKPLCSTPFSQLSTVLPESEPSGLSENLNFLHRGVLQPPARLDCPNTVLQ